MSNLNDELVEEMRVRMERTEMDRRLDVHCGNQGDYKESNPKDAAATARIDVSLFPSAAIVYGALGMAEGDLKYGGYNYRVVGVKTSVYIAACLRHLFKYFWCGEDNDPKTGVPHLGNALACLAIIVDGIESGNIIDDRPPKQQSSLFERAEKMMGHLMKIFPRKTPRYTEIEHGDGKKS